MPTTERQDTLGWPETMFISDSTVTAWNIPPPTRCLVLQGRQFCSPLVSPSEQLQETRCQRTDEHVHLPRSCQLPLQSRQCGICIKDTHKPLLSSKGASLRFPTCWAWASKEKSSPPHFPTPHLRMLLSVPLLNIGPILWRSENQGPWYWCQNPTAFMKKAEKDIHSPLRSWRGKRNNYFPFGNKNSVKTEHITSPF